MFDPNQESHQPPLEEVGKPKETNVLRFYRSVGNWSEFGLAFCTGLMLALLSRSIPGLSVFYVILLGAIAAYIWLMAQGESAGQQKEAKVIGLAIALSVIAGHWDAVVLLIWSVAPIYWVLFGACLAAVGMALLKRGESNES